MQVSTVDGEFGGSGGRFRACRRCSTQLPRLGHHVHLPNQRQRVDQGSSRDSGAPREPACDSVGAPPLTSILHAGGGGCWPGGSSREGAPVFGRRACWVVPCRRVGRAFPGPVGLSWSVGHLVGAIRRRCAMALPGRSRSGWPTARWYRGASRTLAGASGDPGGHMQDPVAEGGDLAAGQLGVLVESDELGPRHQIGCG